MPSTEGNRPLDAGQGEAEERDDPVDIDEKQRTLAIWTGSFHVSSVTRPGVAGRATGPISCIGFKRPAGGADGRTDSAPSASPYGRTTLSNSCMTLEIGILLALACAFATNLGFLYKYRGACAAPPVDMRHPLRSAAACSASKWFAIGMARRRGRLDPARGRARDRADVASSRPSSPAASCCSPSWLSGCSASGRPAPVAGRRLHRAWAWCCWASTLPASSTRRALALLARRHDRLRGRPGRRRRPAHHGQAHRRSGRAPRRHARRRLGHPLRRLRHRRSRRSPASSAPTAARLRSARGSLVTVAASVAAFYASARGLQDGDAVPVIAVTGTAANVAGIAGGILVFGDPLPGNALGIIVQVARVPAGASSPRRSPRRPSGRRRAPLRPLRNAASLRKRPHRGRARSGAEAPSVN